MSDERLAEIEAYLDRVELPPDYSLDALVDYCADLLGEVHRLRALMCRPGHCAECDRER